MVALTRKRNRKTLKRQQRRRIKKHTTRRSKGRLLRTRVKKNKTRKLQRGGMYDSEIMTTTINDIKNIKNITDEEKKTITTVKKQWMKQNYKAHIISYDALKEKKNETLFNQINDIMSKKVINDVFKQCTNNCFDDKVLANLLLDAETLKKNHGWGSIPPLYFTDFLTSAIELDKIKAAREIFDNYYNNNNKVANEHKINKHKKFMTVLLKTAASISKVEIEKVEQSNDNPAVTIFTNVFNATLEELNKTDKLFTLPLGDPTEEEIQKTGNADSFGFNNTGNRAKALAGLPEEGATPSEEGEIDTTLFEPQEHKEHKEPLYERGNMDEE